MSSRLRAQLRATPIVAPLPLSHVLHSRLPNSTVSDEPSIATVSTSRPQLPRLLLLPLQPQRRSWILHRTGYATGATLVASGPFDAARTRPVRPRCATQNSRAIFAVVHEHFHRRGEIAVTVRIEPPTASRRAERNTLAAAARRSAAVHVVCLPAGERPRSYTVPSSPVKMTTSDGCRAAACAARAACASIGQGCGDSSQFGLRFNPRSLPVVNGKGRCVHGNRGRRVRQLHGRCAP